MESNPVTCITITLNHNFEIEAKAAHIHLQFLLSKSVDKDKFIMLRTEFKKRMFGVQDTRSIIEYMAITLAYITTQMVTDSKSASFSPLSITPTTLRASIKTVD